VLYSSPTLKPLLFNSLKSESTVKIPFKFGQSVAP